VHGALRVNGWRASGGPARAPALREQDEEEGRDPHAWGSGEGDEQAEQRRREEGDASDRQSEDNAVGQ